MTTVWTLFMMFRWMNQPSRQIDNIPSKEKCIVLAEIFIKEAQLRRGYDVWYKCYEVPVVELRTEPPQPKGP
jgi:hypothetical protein